MPYLRAIYYNYISVLQWLLLYLILRTPLKRILAYRDHHWALPFPVFLLPHRSFLYLCWCREDIINSHGPTPQLQSLPTLCHSYDLSLLEFPYPDRKWASVPKETSSYCFQSRWFRILNLFRQLTLKTKLIVTGGWLNPGRFLHWMVAWALTFILVWLWRITHLGDEVSTSSTPCWASVSLIYKMRDFKLDGACSS